MTAANAVLVFENTEFDVVDLHNVPWLRGQQIADALKYKNPRQAIDDIYSRNADEFTEEMTRVLELPTAGGVQPVRIFSPRGAYLLGMLARTDKAKAFRAWVLDVLEGKIAPVQSRPFDGFRVIAAHKHINGLIKELKRETAGAIRDTIYAQLTQLCRMATLPCPPLDAIGREETPAAESPLIVEFWELMALLMVEGDPYQLNHSRRKNRIALNLLQVERAARATRLAMPDLNDLRQVLRHSASPRFMGLRAVNSRYGAATVKCWVFEAEQGEEV